MECSMVIYLILPGVQKHDQILWFRVSVTNFAFVTMFINCHFVRFECEIWVVMAGLRCHSNLIMIFYTYHKSRQILLFYSWKCFKRKTTNAQSCTITITIWERRTLITLAWSRIAALHADIDVDVITDAWILWSFGDSLPSDTGRGLSEHGDASRETLSESSSLNTVPVCEQKN